MGLGEERYRPIKSYSTGMKQKVKLAQAIVHDPSILFLDEPTNGLDPPARKRMLDLICEIRDQGETHVVLSSHLLRDVELVCDTVMILKQGRIASCCGSMLRPIGRQWVSGGRAPCATRWRRESTWTRESNGSSCGMGVFSTSMSSTLLE